MPNLLGSFATNFFGFDGIIFLVAVANGFILFTARRSSMRLYNKLHKKLFVPEYLNSDRATKEIEELSETEISLMREKSLKLYSLFCSLTSIFPLMGILGTVISLLSVSGDMSNVEVSFMSALTSTFWGLVFAIGFKVADGFISPYIEDNDRSAELFSQRISLNMKKNFALENELLGDELTEIQCISKAEKNHSEKDKSLNKLPEWDGVDRRKAEPVEEVTLPVWDGIDRRKPPKSVVSEDSDVTLPVANKEQTDVDALEGKA